MVTILALFVGWLLLLGGVAWIAWVIWWAYREEEPHAERREAYREKRRRP